MLIKVIIFILTFMLCYISVHCILADELHRIRMPEYISNSNDPVTPSENAKSVSYLKRSANLKVNTKVDKGENVGVEEKLVKYETFNNEEIKCPIPRDAFKKECQVC